MVSDKFVKYISIENHYQNVYLDKCPQDKYMWCITEKIHGSNFQVFYDGENVLIGSRNHFVDDFNNLKELLAPYMNKIKSLYVNIPVTLYGEVYGDGIQKGVKYSKTKKFRFFDLKVGDTFLPYYGAINIFKELELPYIPVRELFESTFKEVVANANTRFNSEIAEGEYAELEDNLCEGVVIKPYYEELTTIKGDRVIIKKKNEEFFERSHTPKAKVKDDRFGDYKQDLELSEAYINSNRFDSVFSKDEYFKNNFGDFIKAYTEDVVVDAAKDGVKFKNLKNIHNIVAKTTKVEYFSRVAA